MVTTLRAFVRACASCSLRWRWRPHPRGRLANLAPRAQLSEPTKKRRRSEFQRPRCPAQPHHLGGVCTCPVVDPPTARQNGSMRTLFLIATPTWRGAWWVRERVHASGRADVRAAWCFTYSVLVFRQKNAPIPVETAGALSVWLAASSNQFTAAGGPRAPTPGGSGCRPRERGP